MKLRQYTLISPNERTPANKGYREMVVWLEDGRATLGQKVTLKDSDEPEWEWIVMAQHSVIDHDAINHTTGFGGSIRGRGSLND